MKFMNTKKYSRIGVIFGGRSSEHEVSLASARAVMHALEEAGYEVVPIGITIHGRWLTQEPMRRLSAAAHEGANNELALSDEEPHDTWNLLPNNPVEPQLPSLDVIFPVLHGPFGEDGTIQGLLEMANVPYVGSGVLGSAVAMDKIMAKKLFTLAGINQTPSLEVMRSVWREKPGEVIGDIESQVDYPLFVKPANMGSSVGVSRARDRHELNDALDTASLYDAKLVVEAAVPNAREIEVSVLGNETAVASMPGEIIPSGEFYDYNAKYIDDSSELIIPAPISRDQTLEVRKQAVRAFYAVDGAGLARVDFLLDDKSGELYLNEINTMPGFTPISMYPKLWEASGVPFNELVTRLVDLAVERFNDRQQNSTGR